MNSNIFLQHSDAESIDERTRRNGVIDYCQGDTYGIGYYSKLFSVMPFAQGLALKLSKE